MKTIKKWGYYGFTKEEYDSCQHLRDVSNLKNAAIISNVALGLETMLCILALFIPSLKEYGGLYILMACFTLLLLILARTHPKNIRPELIMYGLMSLIYAAGIGISIPSKNEKAILILVIIALLPVLFLDNAWRMTLYISLVCVLYCVMAFQVKLRSVAEVDLYNVLAFGLMSIIIQYFVNQKILDGFVCRAQNEKLLQAYEDAQQELRRQAQTDLMTGLFNRTHFAAQIDTFMDESIKNKDTLYLVMLDLDKFKSINDQLGHQKGDQIIISVAEIIKSHLNESEFATRLGGDEYMFILAERFHQGNLENVVKAVEEEICSIQLAPDWYASGSIGVTPIRMEKSSFDDLYRKTDHALYEAKRLGGSRIVYAGTE